jgi:hypothetical protein
MSCFYSLFCGGMFFVILCVTFFYCYAGSRYAEYCVLIVMLSVVILHARFFTAMPSVDILRAVMPNVLAPFFHFRQKVKKLLLLQAREQCYKTFYVRNLQMFVIS